MQSNRKSDLGCAAFCFCIFRRWFLYPLPSCYPQSPGKFQQIAAISAISRHFPGGPGSPPALPGPHSPRPSPPQSAPRRSQRYAEQPAAEDIVLVACQHVDRLWAAQRQQVCAPQWPGRDSLNGSLVGGGGPNTQFSFFTVWTPGGSPKSFVGGVLIIFFGLFFLGAKH